MPRFLHVGCGSRPKKQTTPVLAGDDWDELRLDVDPVCKPDIVADMTDMAAVLSGSMDAVFAQHTVEHLFPHQVPVALREFVRVLTPTGFAVVACPDLEEVARLITENGLTEPAYQSRIGPISPLDMLYGHGRSLAAGRHTMAHRCGFTSASLMRALQDAGFAMVLVRRQNYQITAYARRTTLPDGELRAWAKAHFT